MMSRFRHHDLLSGQIVIVACLATALVVFLTIRTAESLNWIFAVGFVAICITIPLAASRQALLTASVLPPVLMIAVAAGVAIWAPASVEAVGLNENASTVQRTIAAFFGQASTLGLAFCAGLLAVGLRLAGLKNSAPDV